MTLGVALLFAAIYLFGGRANQRLGERGRRRFLELQAKGAPVDLARTIAEVEARDAADSGRAHSPLRQAEDAVVIDTTGLGIDRVLDEMLRIVNGRRQSGKE